VGGLPGITETIFKTGWAVLVVLAPVFRVLAQRRDLASKPYITAPATLHNRAHVVALAPLIARPWAPQPRLMRQLNRCLLLFLRTLPGVPAKAGLLVL
jgi:hypothetical protein